jgi:predicted Zn-dependent protease
MREAAVLASMRGPQVLALLMLSCGSTPTTPTSAFDKAVTSLVIEVDYVPTAKPTSGRGAALFQLTRTNLDRVFTDTSVKVTLASADSDMEQLNDVTASTYTSDAILAIADQHRQQNGDASTIAFYVVYLDGYYQDSAGTRTDVLGVSVGTTGVIAMFAPVLNAVGANGKLSAATAGFAGETTLLHELSHAIGLVNNGVALQSEHQDSANGKHCTNSECIMYATNEAVDSVREFLTRVVRDGNTILFDDACLADIDAAKQK